MRLGIRAKFVAILVIASVLPLLIGLMSISYLGRDTYLSDKASLYQAMAQYLARHVDHFILSKVDHVHNWVQYGDPMLLAEDGLDMFPKASLLVKIRRENRSRHTCSFTTQLGQLH